ncbi:hypothetical protein EG328_000864 [Venturia inaequalis]|uniref:Uncharacterized protein n=1 Tax=Venturia inaequalis TaxID=5025 RepID=A0A8H3Z3L9_VENIN|nr:hypothetical protein EG328_000864 [Venturia inaequalis]
MTPHLVTPVIIFFKVFSDHWTQNQLPVKINGKTFHPQHHDSQTPTNTTHITFSSLRPTSNEMGQPVSLESPSKVAVSKPVYLTAKSTPDTTFTTPLLPTMSRERAILSNPLPQYFTATPGGAQDQGISQERSEALADFYNQYSKPPKKIAKSSTKEEAARHGRVMTDAIEAAACNAARRGISEALQEHPTCEICKSYYYESRGPKHALYDPQDRLFKCVKWPCKKWYHVGCLNIKYEMRDTYICIGRFAPCVATIRQQTYPGTKTDEPLLRNQTPGIILTGPEYSTTQALATIPLRHAVQVPHNTKPAQQPTPAHLAIPARRSYGIPGSSARTKATKGMKRCRGDGKCMRFCYDGNPAVPCAFAACTLKQLCTSCKNHATEPKGAVHGNEWFCTVECRERCLAGGGGGGS